MLSDVLKTRFERALFGLVVVLASANLVVGGWAVYEQESVHQPEAASACLIMNIGCRA